MARFTPVGEHVLDRRDEAPDVGLGTELFEKLAADGFCSLLAELDCPTQEPEERLVLDLVPAALPTRILSPLRIRASASVRMRPS